MRQAPRPGEVFEGHLIEGEIGRGGMGIVFRARNLALERQRAIKVIAPDLSADPAYAARFRRESRLAASVEHPNVVPIHSAGEDDGLLYIVMRLIDGVDLHRMLGDGPLPPERAIPIVHGVAAALDAAHRAGLVHRDVKPGNVLIEHRTGEERVYLTDFGISKPTSTKTAGGGDRPQEAALTMEGEVLGTADYVAPEQVEDGRSDARSDVYSLACVAYHALTGLPPFRRDTELATLIAQTKAERPLASGANPQLGRRFDGILQRGMAIDPDQRPQSAGELADRIEAALDPSEATTPTLRGAEARTARMGRPARGGRGRRIALIAGSLAIVAAVAVGAVLSLGGGDDQSSAAAPEVVTRDVGKGPVGVAVGDVRVWVASRDQPQPFGGEPGELDRLRLRVPEPAKQPLPLPSPRAVAIGLGKVWVVNGDALYEIGGGREPLRIEAGQKPDDVAVDNNYVWVSDEEGGTVTRVDPSAVSADGQPATKTVDVGGEPRSIAAGERSVWVANAGDGTVNRITPATVRVSPPIPVGPQPTSIAVGPASAWVTDADENDLRELDIRTGKVVGDPIPVAAAPRGVAVGLSSVWVASGGENVVERFDAQTHERIGDPIPVGADPADVAVGISAVYTANQAGNSVTRIQP
jgi:streptogramin lyase